jgi:plastocyanin
MSRLAAAFAILLALPAARSGQAASIEVHVRDAAGKPVADAAVYAVPAAGGVDARGKKLAVVEQADREFVPIVTVVQTGTTVTFPNRDPILHHVYSFSPPKSFEIKLYSGKSPVEVLFDKPGVVTLGCNIHDWMIGYILVVSTPWFGKSDGDGAARLRDLPSGAYELRAWHPQQAAPAPAQSVTLDAGTPPGIEFKLDTQPRKAKYKPPLDRLKY